jgi:hypothetical protein
MTVSTTIRTPHPRRGALIGAAASIAAAGAVASILAFGGGEGTSPAVNHVPSSAAPSAETQRFVEWVRSATPEQLAAAYGTGTR